MLGETKIAAAQFWTPKTFSPSSKWPFTGVMPLEPAGRRPLSSIDCKFLYWVPCHTISQLLWIWFHCARVRASSTEALRINSFAITFPLCSMTRTFNTIIFVLSSAARDEIWSTDADWINPVILPEALSRRAVFPQLFTMSVLAPYCSTFEVRWPVHGRSMLQHEGEYCHLFAVHRQKHLFEGVICILRKSQTCSRCTAKFSRTRPYLPKDTVCHWSHVKAPLHGHMQRGKSGPVFLRRTRPCRELACTFRLMRWLYDILKIPRHAAEELTAL